MPNGPNGQGDPSRYFVAKDSSELLTLLTDATGKLPTAELRLGQGTALPTWTPQIRYRRGAVALWTDFGVANTFYALIFSHEAILHLFQLTGAGEISGFPGNASFPKQVTIDSVWFTVSLGHATLTATGSISINLRYEQLLPTINIPVIAGESYGAAIGIGATNNPRILRLNEPYVVPLRANTSMVGHEELGARDVVLTDLVDWSEMRVIISFTNAVALSAAGVNMTLDF